MDDSLTEAEIHTIYGSTFSTAFVFLLTVIVMLYRKAVSGRIFPSFSMPRRPPPQYIDTCESLEELEDFARRSLKKTLSAPTIHSAHSASAPESEQV